MPRKTKAPPARLDPPAFHRDPGRKDPLRSWYCGPWAIAAITGLSFEDVREAVNMRRAREPNAPVKGMYTRELRAVLADEGFKTRDLFHLQYFDKHFPRPTLARWLRERTPDMMGTTYVVVAGQHFAVVRGRKATCTMLRCWTWISNMKKRRAPVRAVLEVTS